MNFMGEEQSGAVRRFRNRLHMARERLTVNSPRELMGTEVSAKMAYRGDVRRVATAVEAVVNEESPGIEVGDE